MAKCKYPTITEPILCACGCGEHVKIAKYPSQQSRYINTHQHRGQHNGNYKGGKENRTCPVCSKVFQEWPSQVGVTCGSDRCYRMWQGLTTAARGSRKIEVECSHCGKTIFRFPSQAANREYNYCNRFCQSQHHGALFSGVNNGNWRGGKLKFGLTQARIRDNHRCVICGFDMVIDVHHITPRSKGGSDEPSNLITLCPNHHRMADLGLIDVEWLRRTDWQPEDTVLLHDSSDD